MIARKWCLLTGPPVIFGAVVVGTLAIGYFSGFYDPLFKERKLKEPSTISTK